MSKGHLIFAVPLLFFQPTQYSMDHFSGMHNWYACSHARPTYCNVCREALSGVTSHGLSCEGTSGLVFCWETWLVVRLDEALGPLEWSPQVSQYRVISGTPCLFILPTKESDKLFCIVTEQSKKGSGGNET